MTRVEAQSSIMKLLRHFRLDGLAWSLRRLHCPVSSEALVLDVGSGGNPYSRANVLLDAYEESRERHWAPLIRDRPIVLGFAENMPFKDNAFDFIIASHVLEHSRDPVRFLSELQRVGKSGYIEVPDAIMERINPYKDHRLEITVRNNQLLIYKKESWIVDDQLVELYESRLKNVLTNITMKKRPFQFHVRYYWDETIDYVILNPDTRNDWEAPSNDHNSTAPTEMKISWKQVMLRCSRILFSQYRRNARINVLDLLACPDCKASDFEADNGSFKCKGCSNIYGSHDGMPIMYPKNEKIYGS